MQLWNELPKGRNIGTLLGLLICYFAGLKFVEVVVCGTMCMQCALMLIIESMKAKTSISLQDFVG